MLLTDDILYESSSGVRCARRDGSERPVACEGVRVRPVTSRATTYIVMSDFNLHNRTTGLRSFYLVHMSPTHSRNKVSNKGLYYCKLPSLRKSTDNTT